MAQHADHVDVTIANEAGEAETLRAKYIIGTDGASSAVRRLAGIEFEGFTYPERFIKIGTSFDLLAANKNFCTRNYFSDPDEWLNLFKVKGYGPPGIWRGVFPVPAGESDEAAMSPEGVQRRLQGIHPKSGDYDIPYHALYAVHQRVAATFNKGRVLLAGDSAHVNNPIGGMGMNGGIHDAVNLAEKLSDIWYRPRRSRRARPLHAAAAQGADRFRAGADHPEQEVARGKGPGGAAQASRRPAPHLRGREAAQAVSLSLLAVRQPQVGECGGVTSADALPERRSALSPSP